MITALFLTRVNLSSLKVLFEEPDSSLHRVVHDIRVCLARGLPRSVFEGWGSGLVVWSLNVGVIYCILHSPPHYYIHVVLWSIAYMILGSQNILEVS